MEWHKVSDGVREYRSGSKVYATVVRSGLGYTVTSGDHSETQIDIEAALLRGECLAIGAVNSERAARRAR